MIRTTALARARPSSRAPVGIGVGKPRERLPLGAFARSPSVRRFGSAAALLNNLDAHEVGAAVRGTLPAGELMEALERAEGTGAIHRGALLEPTRGSGVLVGPVGITEGFGAPSRASFCRAAAAWLEHSGLLSEAPLVAVLSVGRHEDAGRGAGVARSLKESDAVVARLRGQGLDAFSAGVQLEDVVRDADIVCMPDGAAGNLAFRALHLVAGMRSYGAPVLGTSRRLIDTSRARRSFEDPLRLAAYLAAERPRA